MEITVNKETSTVSWEYKRKVITVTFPDIDRAHLRDDGTIMIFSNVQKNKEYSRIIHYVLYNLNGSKIIKMIHFDKDGERDGLLSWSNDRKQYERPLLLGLAEYYKKYDLILWIPYRKDLNGKLFGISMNNEIVFECDSPCGCMFNGFDSTSAEPRIECFGGNLPKDKYGIDDYWYFFNPETFEFTKDCPAR